MKVLKVRILKSVFPEFQVDSIQTAYMSDLSHMFPYYIGANGHVPTEVTFTADGETWTEFEVEGPNRPYAPDEVEVLEEIGEIPCAKFEKELV